MPNKQRLWATKKSFPYSFAWTSSSNVLSEKSENQHDAADLVISLIKWDKLNRLYIYVLFQCHVCDEQGFEGD